MVYRVKQLRIEGPLDLEGWRIVAVLASHCASSAGAAGGGGIWYLTVLVEAA